MQRGNSMTEKSFTICRGSSIIRKRCIQFIETLHKLGYERIPIDQAKQLFSLTVNVFDRASIKAYFGVYQHVSTRSIQREAHYQSGTYSFKTILLKQKVPYQPGYLELLGLVKYEWVGKILFLIPQNVVLVPTIMKSSESMANFSLTPFTPKGKDFKETDLGGVLNPNGEAIERQTNNNNIGGEREIGRVKVSHVERLNREGAA